MAKNDPRTADDGAPAKPQTTTLADIEAKIAPIDEFRGRAESWMKEVTAQVARLAGRTEEDERRKGALDKRLSDIEERMQSLLTLTEMVSLSKNPFAGPPREAAPSQPQTAPPTEKVAAPEPETPPAAAPETAEPEEDAPSAHTEPAHPPAESPTPAPIPPGPNGVSSESTPVEKGSTGGHPAPAPQIHNGLRQPTAPASAPAPTARLHPNDAAAEVATFPRSQPASVADTFPRRTATHASPAKAPEDHQRFHMLEWARLLAPAARRIDLGGFLGFYVEAGWITSQTASTVRNLTLQLGREADTEGPSMPLDELHARSILLVSRLEGSPTRAEAARSALVEARQVTRGDWVTIER